ncbi:MAG: hypothetical protein ACYDB7_15220, partial [Mycobacteriales bacterium]
PAPPARAAVHPALSAPAPALPAPPSAPSDLYTPFTHRQALGGGAYRLAVFPAPVFRPTPGGSWALVDGELTAAPGQPGALLAAHAAIPMTFGATAADLVTLAGSAGAVTLSGPGLAIGAPALRVHDAATAGPGVLDRADPDALGDATVDYSAVAPGVDLRYDTSGVGLRERLVLADASAPTRFTFHLADPAGLLGAPVADDRAGMCSARRSRTDSRCTWTPRPPMTSRHRGARLTLSASGTPAVRTSPWCGPGTAMTSPSG